MNYVYEGGRHAGKTAYLKNLMLKEREKMSRQREEKFRRYPHGVEDAVIVEETPIMSKKLFFQLLPFLDKKFYTGYIKWMINEKKPGGNGLRDCYCIFCGNIANGLGIVTHGKFKFSLPICHSHMSELIRKSQVINPNTGGHAPFVFNLKTPQP